MASVSRRSKRNIGTHHLEEFDYRLAWHGSDSQPVFNPIHAPLYAFVRFILDECRVVYTQELGRLRVTTCSNIYSDKVEDSAMSFAVNG